MSSVVLSLLVYLGLVSSCFVWFGQFSVSESKVVNYLRSGSVERWRCWEAWWSPPPPPLSAPLCLDTGATWRSG